MIPQIHEWINIDGVYIALDEQKRILGSLKRVGSISARVESIRGHTKPLRPPDGHVLDRVKYEMLQGE